MAKIRVVPVIDVKQGHVVRGVGGRRDHYRPVVSQLTHSSCPTEIARLFQAHYRFTEIYLADLDAIAGMIPTSLQQMLERQIMQLTPEEQQVLAALYQKNLARFLAKPASARQLLQVGEAPSLKQASPARRAALTTVARAILNLNETITRN